MYSGTILVRPLEVHAHPILSVAFHLTVLVLSRTQTIAPSASIESAEPRGIDYQATE